MTAPTLAVFSRHERERRRVSPLSRGARTLRDLVLLLRRGYSYREIATAWDMRPRAGADDLTWDIDLMWERDGSPGAPAEPAEPEGYNYMTDPAWVRWRHERTQAIKAWLDAYPLEAPQPHCRSCTCYS